MKMKITRIILLWFVAFSVVLSWCGKTPTVIKDANTTATANTKPQWMQWQTDEAITEHCKMMPNMEWCDTINK